MTVDRSQTIHISYHAIVRYQQRVSPVSAEEARQRLSSKIIQTAIEFGARHVILPQGQRVVITAGSVVTVLPSFKRRHHRPRCIDA
jgi:hypothetical protein